MLALSGCSPGVRWRLDSFERVHADATRDGKLTLVYFREWTAVECTQFEEQVLSDPAVLRATEPLYCVPLSFHWDQPLAQQWLISRVPGVVILAPGARVLSRLQGNITRERLLEAIASAQAQYASEHATTRRG